jgi:hypothetical protein
MIPVFVICRDRLTSLQRTVAALELAEGIDIVLVDNASTYPPLREYLRSSPHQLIQTGENAGHHAPWDRDLVPRHSPFGVTDPDVVPIPECPPDWPAFMLDIARTYELNKVGFGLKIDDLPESYAFRQQVINHETQFWRTELTVRNGVQVFSAALDTTLAIYPHRTSWDIWPAARTGFPYVAQHLAWYIDSSRLTDDELYYRQHCDKHVASWPYSEDH